MAALCCAILCTFGFTACEGESTHVETYSFGISQLKSHNDDLLKIQNYLESKGAPLKYQTFTAANQEKCDKLAKAKFDDVVSKLSREEINLLGLSSDCSFIYSAARLVDPTNPNSETLYIGKWQYPGE